jgi:hypothetical protein
MVTKIKLTKYTHLPLNIDVAAFAGFYTPEKEGRLQFKGREVLYITGQIVVETTCGPGSNCKPANYYYANVPGYIIKWQYEKNKEGLPVTEIETISDTETRDTIREIILKNEPVARVDFW